MAGNKLIKVTQTYRRVEVVLISWRLQPQQWRQWCAEHWVAEVIAGAVLCAVFLMVAHVFTVDDSSMFVTSWQTGDKSQLRWRQQLFIRHLCTCTYGQYLIIILRFGLGCRRLHIANSHNTRIRSSNQSTVNIISFCLWRSLQFSLHPSLLSHFI